MTCVSEKDTDGCCIHNYYITYEAGSVSNCCHCCHGTKDCSCCCSNNNGNGDDDEGIGNGPGKGVIDITLIGTSGDDKFHSLIVDGEDYIAYGRSNNSALIARFDKNLKLINKKGFANTNLAFFLRAQSKKDKGVIAVGNLSSTGAYFGQFAEFDKDFNLIKEASYQSGNGTAYITNITSTPDDFTGSAKYLVTGYTKANAGFLVSYDANMNLLQQIQLSSVSHLWGVLSEKDRIIAVGYSAAAGGAGSNDGLIAIFDDSLNLQKTIHIGCSRSDVIRDILKTEDGYIVAGQTQRADGKGWDVWIMTFDENFTMRKKRLIETKGDYYICCLRLDAKGRPMLITSTSSVGAGGLDVLLMIFNKDLEILNHLTLGGKGTEIYADVVANADGSHTIVSFTTSAGAGGEDAFIARISGKWSDLTGSIPKYPALKINVAPSIANADDFVMTFNDTITLSTVPGTLVALPRVGSVVNLPGIIVDPKAVFSV